MEGNPSQRSVAELAGARMPADQGLAGLGLLMQLGGSLFLGLMILTAVMPLFLGGHPDAWNIFLLAALGAVRSVLHRSAGTALVYGAQAGPYRATKVYIVASAVHTAAWMVLLSKLGLGAAELVSLGFLLLAWPAVLSAVLAWPRLRRHADGSLPPAEDLGFEGVSILMSVFGVVGALCSGLALIVLFHLPGVSFTSPHLLLFVGVFAVLLVRSVLHAHAGIAGTRGIDAEGASDRASRYYSFAAIAAVIVGGALMIEFMMTTVHPLSLFVVGIVVYWLLIWPLAVRRFYTERNFAVLLAAEEAPAFRRSPDAGLTALGWLLLALGSLGLADALPKALLDIGPSSDELVAFGGFFGNELASALGRSQWWHVGVAAFQLWAAVELITMSDRFKLAATVYGVVAVGVCAYVYWPLIKALDTLGAALVGLNQVSAIMQYGLLAIALVVPIATLLLANRRLTPVATARLRDETP